MITSDTIAHKLGFARTAEDSVLDPTVVGPPPPLPPEMAPDSVSQLRKSLVEAIGEDFLDTGTPEFKYPKHPHYHHEAIPSIESPPVASDEDVARVFRDLQPGETLPGRAKQHVTKTRPMHTAPTLSLKRPVDPNADTIVGNPGR